MKTLSRSGFFTRRVISRAATLALLLSLGSLHSQSDLHGQSDPDAINASFRVFMWNDPPHTAAQSTVRLAADGGIALSEYRPPELGFINASGEVTPLSAVRRRLSPRYRYTGANPLILATRPETPAAQLAQAGALPAAEPLPPVELGRTWLPAGKSELTLFLFPAATAGGVTYRVAAIPSSTQDIPAGSARLINLCGEDIALKAGEEQLLLKSNGTASIRLGDMDDNRLPVLIGSQEKDGTWKRRMQQRLPIPRQATPIIVFYKAGDYFRSEIIDAGSD